MWVYSLLGEHVGLVTVFLAALGAAVIAYLRATKRAFAAKVAQALFAGVKKGIEEAGKKEPPKKAAEAAAKEAAREFAVEEPKAEEIKAQEPEDGETR